MGLLINNLAVFHEGDPSNIPLLFVHGFPYDHQMWNNQAAAFKPSNFCVSYDIRGLGESPAGDGQLTMESFADDLEKIIDELKLDHPVLCGLSMGGYISLRAVERMETKFRALILCDTKSESDNNETKLKRAAGIKRINIEGVRNFVADFVPNCFAKESIEKLGEEYIAILGRSMNSNPIGVKGCLMAMAGRTDTTGYLSKIKIPVLVLCGEKDTLSPPESMRAMADKIKGSEFKVVPGSGHMSAIENPAFVNEKIRKFLSKISLINS
ncbi:MAG TPA: alpha/beta fold hydrolase [Ignavibacteriaceae bacterium]|nr:alpha/beta fold hydrolase [Ignavibacteriaceae bacterium]